MDGGDWTTWEGISAVPDEANEAIRFGTAPTKKQAPDPAPKRTKGTLPGPSKAIVKKQKAPRAAGLMKVKASPAAVEPKESEVTNSPYIIDSINPFAVLDNSAEEEAAEAAAAAEAEAKVKKTKAVAKSRAAPTAAPAKENSLSATPIARRTRAAAKFISQAFADVVAAVSPMLERSTQAVNRPSRLRAA